MVIFLFRSSVQASPRQGVRHHVMWNVTALLSQSFVRRVHLLMLKTSSPMHNDSSTTVLGMPQHGFN